MHLLALQLKRIGDAVLTAPALAAAKAAHPGATLTLALAGPAAALAPAFTAADHVLVYRRRRPNLGFWSGLARTRFDLSLDFTGNDRSALATRLANASARHGYRRFAKTAWRTRPYTGLADASVRDLHTVDFHLALVAAASGSGGGSPAADTGFAPPPDTPLPAGLPGRFALLHPGTARTEKYWAADRWAAVADHLHHDLDLPVVLTGADGAEERRHLDALRRQTAAPLVDLAGKLSLLQLAQLAARASLVLSVDSAAAHLAAVARTPQVALFGPTNPFHWRPRHDRAHTLQGSGDQPLTDFQPRAKGHPMAALSTAAVIRAIGTALGQPPPPASDGGGRPDA